jgi:hypothetical protein
VNSVSKADRTVTVAIEDGLNPAVSASYTLKVAADDDAIEIKNADTSLLAAPESAAASASNPISLPIFVDTGVALTFIDPDTAGSGSTVISEIKVSVSNFDAADSLLFGTAALPTVYDGVKGELTGNTLTLTANPGSSPNAGDFATALQTIRFTNNSDTPNTSAREVSIKINGATLLPFRTINVVATNDPPEMSVVTIPNYSVSTGTGTGSSLELPVASLLSQVSATDRDGDTLRLDITNVTNGGGGTWQYRNTSTSAFENLTTGQVVENAGTLRFDGATTEVATPSLSFKARDASASSTNNSTISVTLVSPFNDINSTTGPKQTHDAGTGKTRIIFDALANALNNTSSAPDDITNFNPTEDVIRFRGTDFKSGDSMWSEKSVVSVSSGSTTVSSTADIIFLEGSNDTAANTLASNNTLQASTIIVHRAISGAIRLYYVDDSGASPATRQMATITLGAPATWTTFVNSGASAFEILAP